MVMRSILLAVVAALALAFTPARAQSPGQTAARPAGQPATVVNLNTASSAELQALPGIGAATAARIIEFRQKNGPFKKIEEVMNVQGIGEKIFLRLKPQLSVGTGAVPASQQQ
jgi:competence protein ComEA